MMYLRRVYCEIDRRLRRDLKRLKGAASDKRTKGRLLKAFKALLETRHKLVAFYT